MPVLVRQLKIDVLTELLHTRFSVVSAFWVLGSVLVRGANRTRRGDSTVSYSSNELFLQSTRAVCSAGVFHSKYTCSSIRLPMNTPARQSVRAGQVSHSVQRRRNVVAVVGRDDAFLRQDTLLLRRNK